jgi:hypothetical protein
MKEEQMLMPRGRQKMRIAKREGVKKAGRATGWHATVVEAVEALTSAVVQAAAVVDLVDRSP